MIRTPTSIPMAGSRPVSNYYALATSTLGYVYVLASKTHLLRVEFVDIIVPTKPNDGSILSAFMAVNESERSPESEAVATAIAKHVDCPVGNFQFPLSFGYTRHQKRVWDYLQTIPSGTAQTYQEIADTLGIPFSSETVEKICLSNPLAVLIPCHRAIADDGTVGSYRWGEQRKSYLLSGETRNNPGPKRLYKYSAKTPTFNSSRRRRP